jgi:hypothetical protein
MSLGPPPKPAHARRRYNQPKGGECVILEPLDKPGAFVVPAEIVNRYCGLQSGLQTERNSGDMSEPHTA